MSRRSVARANCSREKERVEREKLHKIHAAAKVKRDQAAAVCDGIRRDCLAATDRIETLQFQERH
jgi:hypothetical protein